MAFEVISILAGGYSAIRYNIKSLPGFVIGVNDSAILGNCNACVSMDRLWTEARWPLLLKSPKPSWLRDAALRRITDLPKWVTVFDCDYKSSVMTDENNILNGTNSGLCAVNLAFQLRPQRLELYGLDGSHGPHGEKHWYKDYDFKPPNTGTSLGKHKVWQGDLGSALEQCKSVGIQVRMMK